MYLLVVFRLACAMEWVKNLNGDIVILGNFWGRYLRQNDDVSFSVKDLGKSKHAQIRECVFVYYCYYCTDVFIGYFLVSELF